jgi:hypothetical protein
VRFSREAASNSVRAEFLGGSRLLNYRSPTQIIDLEQPTKTHHESRDATDHMLRDRHCNQNDDLKMAIRNFLYSCRSKVLSVHVFSEVVRSLCFACLKGKIYFSRYGENIAQFVVLPKKFFIPQSVVV